MEWLFVVLWSAGGHLFLGWLVGGGVALCWAGLGGWGLGFSRLSEGGGLWAVSKVGSLEHSPCLQRFILLVSFRDTLLVVSILDIVYDCHLFAICNRFCSPEWVKNHGFHKDQQSMIIFY